MQSYHATHFSHKFIGSINFEPFDNLTLREYDFFFIRKNVTSSGTKLGFVDQFRIYRHRNHAFPINNPM